MTDKPMTPERFSELKALVICNDGIAAVQELAAEIDRLRSPPDEGEVAEAIQHQRELATYFNGDDCAYIPQSAMVTRAKEAADLLTRLAASLAAMRERAEFAEAQLRGTNANIAGWLAARDAQMGRANLAERQRDEALAALKPLLAFWRRVQEFEGQCQENDFWDWSVDLGLFQTEPYDPKKHGPHEEMSHGDNWYSPTDIIRSLKDQTP